MQNNILYVCDRGKHLEENYCFLNGKDKHQVQADIHHRGEEEGKCNQD